MQRRSSAHVYQENDNGDGNSNSSQHQNGSGATSTLTVPRGGDSTTLSQRHPHATPGTITANPTAATASPAQRKRAKKRRVKRIRHSGFSSSPHGLFSWSNNDREAIVAGLLGCVIVFTSAYVLYVVLKFLLVPRPPIYVIPESMKDIGDKSDAYARLRLAYDESHPDDPIRTRSFVESLHKRTYRVTKIPTLDETTHDDDDILQEHYDIYNCPDTPPKGYPYHWNLLKLLNHWPPDDTTPHDHLYQGLCVFDYMLDYHKAVAYRDAELPFVTRNDPNVLKTAERWNSPPFLQQLLGRVRHRTEYSPSNHFMYWVKPTENKKRKRKKKRKHPDRFNHTRLIVEQPENWTQPTKLLRLTYDEWFRHANVSDDLLGPDQEHWYYRLIGCGYMDHGHCDVDSSEFLFDELPFFQPKEGSLYLVDVDKQRGIHCRFGMKGVIAENHFDGSRNSIVVLGGERRYILAHPNQCKKLALYPKNHPSARHSAVDWSDPDLDEYPEFAKARANEVVLQAGDVLVLPTNWFHYIVSLELNFQCNTRSGIGGYQEEMDECGFDVPPGYP